MEWRGQRILSTNLLNSRGLFANLKDLRVPLAFREPGVRVTNEFSSLQVTLQVYQWYEVFNASLFFVFLFFVVIKPENPYCDSRLGVEEKPLGVYPLGPRCSSCDMCFVLFC